MKTIVEYFVARSSLLRLVAVMALTLGCWAKMEAAIFGANSIHPGVNESYSFNFGTSPSWSIKDVNGQPVSAALLTVSQSAFSATVLVNKSITVGFIVIEVSYTDSNNQPATDQLQVEVLPFIKQPAMGYAGESINLQVQDNNTGMSGHNLCSWSWSCSNPSVLWCPGNNCNNNSSNTAVLTVPVSGMQPNYTINCTQKCGLGAVTFACQPVTVLVMLRDPVITGQIGVGCTQSQNLTYSCSQPAGATFFNWTVPLGWTITSGQNTNVINVTTSGSGAGPVQVRAFASNGSPVMSNLVTLNVVCCTANMVVNSQVNSGSTDNREADLTINASNTVQAGSTARYHAGGEVRLNVDFAAESGSVFHAYIEGCTNTFSSRSANPEQPEGNGDVPVLQTIFLPEQSKAKETLLTDNIQLGLFPNPSDGTFNISTNTSLRKSVTVVDAFGKTVFEGESDEVASFRIHLQGNANGVYFVKIVCGGREFNRKLVLQN